MSHVAMRGIDRTVITLLGLSSVLVQVYLEYVTSQEFVRSQRLSSNTELAFLTDLIKIHRSYRGIKIFGKLQIIKPQVY